MPEENSHEIVVPRLAPTDRLVAIAPLHLADARNGAPPALTTALRLGWRPDRLFIRFDCRHRGITATLREDNSDLWTEDVVEAFLGRDDPPTRYLELEVNPLGATFSAMVDSPNLSREGMSVERIELPGFEARVRVRDRVWSAVLSIPMSSIPVGETDRSVRAGWARDPRESELRPRVESISRADRKGLPDMFLANFFRIDRTSGEFSALFPTLADPPDFHVPERFGRFRLA